MTTAHRPTLSNVQAIDAIVPERASCDCALTLRAERLDISGGVWGCYVICVELCGYLWRYYDVLWK